MGRGENSMLYVTGVAASAGLAVGTIKRIHRARTGLTRVVLDCAREKALFEAAILLAKDELSQLEQRADSKDKDIFLFQRVMLDDKGLLDEISKAIDSGIGSAAAVERAAEIYIRRIRSIENEYLRERATDVQDACQRVVNILDGRPRETLHLSQPAIVAANEIYPSDIVSVDKGLILGIVTASGSAQGHAAIISRTMGIPAIVQAGEEFLEECDGQMAALDGFSGELFLSPDQPTKARFLHRIRLRTRQEQKLEALKKAPCITPDGKEVCLLANCSCPEDIELAMEKGADGVGLLRSEFMLMAGKMPTEQEQYIFYRRCLEAAGGKPVTVRTFDIGADKEVEGISHQEDNPALGLRGIRLCLARQDLLQPQLAALLRAAVHGPLKIMFPMIATPEEFQQAMQVVEQVKKQLWTRGVSFSEEVPIGTMIETPAAALMAEQLAPLCDFFSIGTNDLIQYAHAADRVNPLVAQYYPTFSPAVHALIQMAVDAANKNHISISVCGESAANPSIARHYVDMGIKNLSMAVVSLLEVKESLMESSPSNTTNTNT